MCAEIAPKVGLIVCESFIGLSGGLSIRCVSASIPQLQNSRAGCEVLGTLPVCYTVVGFRFYLKSYRQGNGGPMARQTSLEDRCVLAK